ncbi:hypothetical protein HRR77_004441 [Exophiala dermatitidis]|nr:hypothetical protein HRR77_004441 [Exophiala dermatitidis]KAJ4623678.1 hypothetical protein HRR85_000539 [Exophiala dermatitidis]
MPAVPKQSTRRMMGLPLNGGGPFTTAQPVLCTEQHSVLQQERLYLIQTLEKEERRKTTLAAKLSKAEAEFETSMVHDSPDFVKRTQKSIKKLRSKLNRCERNEQTLSMSLANVVEKMRNLEQCQWSKSHPNHVPRNQCQATTLPTFASSIPIVASQWPLKFDADPAQVDAIPAMAGRSLRFCPPPFRPLETVMFNNVPQGPMLRPMQLSSWKDCANDGHIHLPRCEYNKSRWAGLDCTITSPTDTVSTYDLSPSATMAQHSGFQLPSDCTMLVTYI